jgi:glycosyltransferase involved in cell wall biosynthesis
MNLTSEPLVTVVTPVYNGEKYLSECIESVLAQTYQNWEYVIVNNCSTDRSLEIAQSYTRRDSRIRIHSNAEFVGITRNHNIGLQQISNDSKYCKFVHADDWLFPGCLRQMVKLAEENPSVGIVGAYRLEDVRVELDGLPYPSTVVPGKDICRATLLGGPYVFGSPTSVLVRCDLIRKRNVFYDESNLHSDTAACYDVLQESDFGFVHQVLTFTRKHEEAVSSHAERFNTYILSSLMVLLKYGPVYLSSEECEECLQGCLERYYRFLGRSVFERKGKQFWDFHKDRLRDLGHPLSSRKLLRASLLELAKIIKYSGSVLVVKRFLPQAKGKKSIKETGYSK